MLMTEEEAKTKWCPMTRNEFESVHGKSLVGNHAPAPCLASSCMMWRYGRKPNPAWESIYVGPSPHVERKETPLYIEDRERGYCGLAGKPEGV